MEESPTTHQRNAEITRRYAEGETLVAIGEDYSLTRERIRQIVSARTGSLAAKSRQVRTARKDLENKSLKDKFMTKFGDFARMAAIDGMTIDETVLLIQEIDTKVEFEFAHRALIDSGMSFNKSHLGFTFPDELIHLGMWYLIGKLYAVEPVKMKRLSNQELATLRLQTGMSETNASTRAMISIVELAESAKAYAKANPKVSITAAKYTKARIEAEKELEITSLRANLAFPATSQTAVKRFGGWSEAVKSIGLVPSTVGRPKGLTKYTREEYVQSLTEFLEYCAARKVSATVMVHADWVVEQRTKGKIHPTTASVRNVWGTWNNAMREVKEVDQAA